MADKIFEITFNPIYILKQKSKTKKNLIDKKLNKIFTKEEQKRKKVHKLNEKKLQDKM